MLYEEPIFLPDRVFHTPSAIEKTFSAIPKTLDDINGAISRIRSLASNDIDTTKRVYQFEDFLLYRELAKMMASKDGEELAIPQQHLAQRIWARLKNETDIPDQLQQFSPNPDVIYNQWLLLGGIQEIQTQGPHPQCPHEHMIEDVMANINSNILTDLIEHAMLSDRDYPPFSLQHASYPNTAELFHNLGHYKVAPIEADNTCAQRIPRDTKYFREMAVEVSIEACGLLPLGSADAKFVVREKTEQKIKSRLKVLTILGGDLKGMFEFVNQTEGKYEDIIHILDEHLRVTFPEVDFDVPGTMSAIEELFDARAALRNIRLTEIVDQELWNEVYDYNTNPKIDPTQRTRLKKSAESQLFKNQ